MELVNKVAKSGLITIDMEQFMPEKEVVEIDVKQFLIQEFVLKEADFRTKLLAFDFGLFHDKIVGVYCSNDALVPTWAYMLIAKHLVSCNATFFFGNSNQALEHEIHRLVSAYNISALTDAKVILKGCADKFVSPSAYLLLSRRLLPIVKTLMYGEPCSTVPIFKKVD